MRITEAEQKIRRERMLHAAYDLFCEQGIDSVTMEKIAKASGVSLNSVFRYFDSKAELLEQTQTLLWQALVARIQEDNRLKLRHCDAQTGLAELHVLLYGFENLYENHSQYIFFAYEYKAYLVRKHMKSPRGTYDRTMQPVREIFFHALERGHADGSISRSKTPEEQFTLLWGMMRHLVEQMLVHTRIYEDPSPWEGLFAFVVEKIMETLRGTP